MRSESACVLTGCNQPALGVCIQCGNGYCAQHGGWQAGYGERCRNCYALLLAGLVNAHHQAGKLPEAMQVLGNPPGGPATPEDQYYLGLALAASGELEAALSNLDDVLNRAAGGPLESPARQAAAGVLSARAVQHLQADQILEAADDLRRSLALSPDGDRARGELLATLSYRSAYEYFRAGRLADALREWEAVQQGEPCDLRLTHYLAVLYYRVASELEGKQPAEADRYWQLAIAHWAVVLENPHFWELWAAQRSLAVGEISEQALSDVVETSIKRLQTGFREYRARYLETGQIQLAERQAEYDIAFTHERHAARSMLNILQRAGHHPGNPGFACGPLMLEHLRSLTGGAQLAEELAGLAQSDPETKQYFSPLGRFYVMVMELGRYQEALTGLEAWLKKDPADKAAQELLVQACIESGNELLEAKDPKTALAIIEKAAPYNLRQHKVRPLIAKAAVAQTTGLLQEENRLYVKDGDNQDKQILGQAAKLVETAITLLERLKKSYAITDADFTAQLAEAYFRRGLIRNRLGQNQGSLEDITRTLEIDPNHAAASDNLVTLLMNRAFDFLAANNPEQAVELLQQAIARNPGKVDPLLAGQIIFALGIKHANTAISSQNYGFGFNVCDMLRNALAEIDEAIKLDPGNRQYQTERQKVYQIFRQLNCR